MSAAQIILALLRASPAVLAVVKPAAMAVDQLLVDTTPPAILIEDGQSAPLPLVASIAMPLNTMVEVTVVTTLQADNLRAIVRAVTTALHAQRGPVAGATLWSSVLESTQPPEPDRDAGLIKQTITFGVIYEE